MTSRTDFRYSQLGWTLSKEIEARVETDSMIEGDISTGKMNTTIDREEQKDTIETKEENVGAAENSHMIEDEIEAEVTIAEEDEKDRNQGVKTIGMDEDNAMSIKTRVSAGTRSGQDTTVNLTMGNLKERRIVSRRVEDQRMDGC